MTEKRRTGWLQGGLLGVLVLTSVGILMPFLMQRIFCFRPGLDFLCHEIPNFISSNIYIIDWLAYFFCLGVCKGEGGMIHIFTIIPSFFLTGVAVTYVIRKVRSPDPKIFE